MLTNRHHDLWDLPIESDADDRRLDLVLEKTNHEITRDLGERCERPATLRFFARLGLQMRLTELGQPIVPRQKVEGYLLSEQHPGGRHKAVFFRRFGYSAERMELLVQALLDHAANNEISAIEQTAFGRRYVIEGIMPAPDGRAPLIRSVWFIEFGDVVPRFVTAYPVLRPAHD